MPETAEKTENVEEVQDPQDEGNGPASGDVQDGAEAVQQAKDDAPEQQATDDVPKDVIETGRIFFFYRPRVGVEEVKKLVDVQRAHIILEPLKPQDTKPRLIIVPKKRLPDHSRHERFFAFVESVGDTVKDLTKDLGPSSYDTKTQGHREQGAARAVGVGAYVIANNKRGTRLGYKLEIPDEPGEAQQLLKIGKTGSMVISVKNPDNQSPGVPVPPNKAEYSAEQRQLFGDRAWIDVKEPSLLDVEGSQLLLIGARDNPEEDLPDDAVEVLEEVYVSDQEDTTAQDDQDTKKGGKHKGGPPSEEAAAKKLKTMIEPGPNEPIPLAPAVEGKLE